MSFLTTRDISCGEYGTHGFSVNIAIRTPHAFRSLAGAHALSGNKIAVSFTSGRDILPDPQNLMACLDETMEQIDLLSGNKPY